MKFGVIKFMKLRSGSKLIEQVESVSVCAVGCGVGLALKNGVER